MKNNNFFWKKNLGFVFLVFFVFLIKLSFTPLPSFGFDMGSWLGWAWKLASGGLSSFYSDSDWTQYTPGYLYYLWLIGKLGFANEMAIKIPVLLADIGLGLIIRSVVKKNSLAWANLAFVLYTLNPVVIFDGSVWGQIDGLLTLFIFGSAYFLIEKKNLAASVFLWCLAFLIKPQSIAVLPALAAYVFIVKPKLKEVLVSGIVGAVTLIGVSLPFFPNDPILGLPHWIIKMGEFYSYTSVFAFNIWSWVGFWKPDDVPFLGINLSVWGSILLVSAAIFAVMSFRKKLGDKTSYYMFFGVLSLSFFVFPTRVHERYLFPVFAFLITSACLKKSKSLVLLYSTFSLASFLNLYYPYAYYYKNVLFSQALYTVSENLAKIIGFVFLAGYFLMIFWEKIPEIKIPDFRSKELAPTPEVFEKINIKLNQRRLILFSILGFALVTRIFGLGSPKEEYFDEVYHAFTAKVIVDNDPKAWEWWNTPPEGFAYEWTHPPLAKIGMFASMKLFGVNAFAYRLPQAILGLGCVYLVYLLARELFKDEATALLSAGIFSLDGLALVMSRIGMNDSYLLFFVLASIYFFYKQRDFRAALFFGLALSSKWSAIWAIPILGILWLKRKKKLTPGIIWYFTIPVVVYLLSYTQMFLTGHDLSVWWEMQQQMWWYHTGLKASHPYSSPWWSWPLLIRPIYLYTSPEIGGFVSRIYAMGNPVVFWFGLSSVIIGFIYALVERNKNLGFVIFSYLIFFVPWALSPRIMFLYHYLPSIPFLAIVSGFILRRNLKLVMPLFIVAFLFFVYFYPHWTGMKIPIWLDNSYYWVNTWR